MKEYLLEQGIQENEIDEILSNFDENVSEDDLQVVHIYESAKDLAHAYVDYIAATPPSYFEAVKAVIDYLELGKHVIDTNDSYMWLNSTGRVIEFKM